MGGRPGLTSWGQSQRSERRSARAGVQPNKLEEMMPTIVITGTVCLFVISGTEDMFLVLLVC